LFINETLKGKKEEEDMFFTDRVSNMGRKPCNVERKD